MQDRYLNIIYHIYIESLFKFCGYFIWIKRTVEKWKKPKKNKTKQNKTKQKQKQKTKQNIVIDTELAKGYAETAELLMNYILTNLMVIGWQKHTHGFWVNSSPLVPHIDVSESGHH